MVYYSKLEESRIYTYILFYMVYNFYKQCWLFLERNLKREIRSIEINTYIDINILKFYLLLLMFFDKEIFTM